jgi:transcriptional regulator with XRE-family HTH domain
MKSKELCIYLERLRAARNISQETFTENVVSLRQYRRYINGESDIPFQIIHNLTTKLGVKTDNLLRELENVKVEETRLINKLYNLAVNLAHDEFIKLSQEVPLEHIIEKSNQLLYQHSVILDNLYQKKLTKFEAATQNAILINYPKILNQKIMTSIEMLILSSFLDVFDVTQHEQIIAKIKDFISDNSLVISGGNDMMMSLVLARIAKYYGIKENYSAVLEYCNIGIQRNIQLKSYFLMDYFYYYSALVHYELKNMELYEKCIVECFNVLHFEDNADKIQKFTNLINEDFNIEFRDFVIAHYTKNKLEPLE